MEQSLIQGLGHLGLNEKQSLVYLALLRLGKGSSYAVSEVSGIKKPTTYVILDELIKKGVVHKIPRSNKKMYRAVAPELLLKEAENRLLETKQSLPALRSLMSTRQEKIKVLHFEGLNGFKEALYYRNEDSLGKEIVGFYSEADGMSQKLLDICEEYNKFTAKNNVDTKAFVPDHPSLLRWRKTDKEHKRTIKILPMSSYSSKVSIDTFSNIVRIMMNGGNQAVIIENSELAKTIREVFQLIWEKPKA